MSDNLDVVPAENIVDAPDNHVPEAVEAETADTDSVSLDAEGNELDGEIVSLDDEPETVDEEAEPDGEEEETDTDEGSEDESGETDEEEAPEMVEFNFGGDKLEVEKGSMPDELVDRIQKFTDGTWAKVTQQSQANAETAKQLQQRAEVMDKLETLGNETLEAFTKGKSIKAEIEQLNAVDMQALWQSDPDRARQLTDYKAQKSAELNEIIGQVDAYERQLSQTRQQEAARKAEEGKQYLDRKYKGFSTEIAPQLENYVVENYGMTKEEASQWAMSPKVAEMALKAMKFDQMQKAGKPKVQPKSKAKPVKPVKAKGAASNASTDPARMSVEQMAKHLGY